MQLKREAKLLTVIGLNTKHADCRIKPVKCVLLHYLIWLLLRCNLTFSILDKTHNLRGARWVEPLNTDTVPDVPSAWDGKRIYMSHVTRKFIFGVCSEETLKLAAQL